MKKSKHKPQVHYNITEVQLRKIKDEVANEACNKMCTFMLAYLMEDENIHYDEDKIIDTFMAMERWSEALDEHLISIRKVCDIIQEKTGIEVRW